MANSTSEQYYNDVIMINITVVRSLIIKVYEVKCWTTVNRILCVLNDLVSKEMPAIELRSFKHPCALS